MLEFFVFLGKFWWKLVRLTGVVALVKSRPVQFLWHSPALRVPRQWLVPFAVVGLVLAIILISNSEFEEAKLMVQNRPGEASVHFRLAMAAAKQNDFALAEKEFALASQLTEKSVNPQVLGSNSEAEEARELVFPEQKIAGEIFELEKILKEKPGYRDVLLRLAVLHWKIDNVEKAREYFEEARVLDPNNEVVEEVGELLKD